MAKQLLLLNEFLPASALGLGWLTESLTNPAVDACQLQTALPDEAVLRTVGQNFESLASLANTNAIRLSLTRLLTNANSIKNSKEVKLESVKVNRYQLRQPKAIFKTFIQTEYARSWLNDTIQMGHKSYLVVELQTAIDPTLTREENKEKSLDLDLSIPVSTIATGGADILGLGQQLDSGIGGGHSHTAHNHKSFSIEGEQIFAIGFKRVVWKSFGFSKNLDKAQLDDKITWSVLGEKRGASEEEVIVADLADELDGRLEPYVGEESKGDEEADGDTDEDEEEELMQLIDNSVECGDQVFMIAPEEP